MTYWDGWERMRFSAAAVEPGAEWKEDVATWDSQYTKA